MSTRLRAVTFLALVLVLAGGAALLGWRLGSASRADAGAADIAAYPQILSSFDFVGLDGESYAPQTMSESVVLVDFWATWCRPCDVQARLLEPLYDEYKERGVAFLAVSVGEDEETVRSFVEDKPYSYPVVLDPEGLMMERGNVHMLPTVMVLDQDRNVAFLREGITGAPKLRSVLDSVLGAEPAE